MEGMALAKTIFGGEPTKVCPRLDKTLFHTSENGASSGQPTCTRQQHVGELDRPNCTSPADPGGLRASTGPALSATLTLNLFSNLTHPNHSNCPNRCRPQPDYQFVASAVFCQPPLASVGCAQLAPCSFPAGLPLTVWGPSRGLPAWLHPRMPHSRRSPSRPSACHHLSSAIWPCIARCGPLPCTPGHLGSRCHPPTHSHPLTSPPPPSPWPPATRAPGTPRRKLWRSWPAPWTSTPASGWLGLCGRGRGWTQRTHGARPQSLGFAA